MPLNPTSISATDVAKAYSEIHLHCEFCGTSDTEVLYSAVDENHRISDTKFEYVKCPACKCIYLPKTPNDLGAYYKNDYYDIPTLEHLQELASKDLNKIAIVKRFCDNGDLLEVGPAFGVFAFQAKTAGFSVNVIEMDKRCCDFIRGTLGIHAFQSSNPVEAMQILPQHDVIAIWHVLEHLPQTSKVLQAAAANLKPHGILAIAMPNPDAWQFKVMGRHWPHLDAPRHLALIPNEWLTNKAAELGLERVFLTFNDSDAKSWNRFGWQRLLMNRFSFKFMKQVMFVLGYALSILATPFDRADSRGSAYTIIFRKKITPL
jgi:2-polyprenyl-3-methyl-5-hydroxy-6-metoxy-1,4-benzoquinol methylase